MKDILLASGPLYFLIFLVLAMIGLFSFILKLLMKKQYKNLPKANVINEKEEAKRKAAKMAGSDKDIKN